MPVGLGLTMDNIPNPVPPETKISTQLLFWWSLPFSKQLWWSKCSSHNPGTLWWRVRPCCANYLLHLGQGTLHIICILRHNCQVSHPFIWEEEKMRMKCYNKISLKCYNKCCISVPLQEGSPFHIPSLYKTLTVESKVFGEGLCTE